MEANKFDYHDSYRSSLGEPSTANQEPRRTTIRPGAHRRPTNLLVDPPLRTSNLLANRVRDGSFATATFRSLTYLLTYWKVQFGVARETTRRRRPNRQRR